MSHAKKVRTVKLSATKVIGVWVGDSVAHAERILSAGPTNSRQVSGEIFGARL
jgi:hypothetical protein